MGLVFGAICFASCDVFNKVSGTDDALIPTLFYTALYTAALSAPLAYMQWSEPKRLDMIMTIILGANANILFYCLLKAFQTLQLSQVASLRYLELVLAIGAGFIFFGEIPSISTLMGSVFVILGATLAITESQSASLQSSEAS
jgi:S-adenosylmethionine uptake transporter